MTDWNLIFVNARVGLVIVITRLTIWYAMGIIMLMRLDVSIFPSNLIKKDMGHKAYMAMMLIDLLSSNPIVLVFIEFMQVRLLSMLLL